jgi:predicted Zn-dependent protease
MFVSEAEEIEMGRQAAPSLNWSYGGEFHDPELKAYLEGIVKKLWENSERPYLPLKFSVQNTSVPNAFALPGYVAITRGLLAELQNEAQFVAVMGHEVGHVMARHSAKRMTQLQLQQLGLIIGGVVLSESKQRDLILGIGAVSSSLLLLKYSREQELQSDRLGVRYMAALGYDPYEAMNAHEQLQVAVDNYLQRQGVKSQKGSLLEAILSTHPRHEIRLEEIRQMIKELPPYKITGDGKGRERFLRKTRRLREVNKAYFVYDKAVRLYEENRLDEAEKTLKKAISMNASQSPFYNLYGMIKLKLSRYDEAEGYFKKALNIDSRYQPAIYGQGLVFLNRKQYRQAIDEFKKSLKLYPSHPGSVFGTGKSYFKLKMHSKAIPYLRQFAFQSPRHPEVHGMLGISYEAVGNIRSAIREYELQVKVAPNTELGRYSKKRLEVLRRIQGQFYRSFRF